MTQPIKILVVSQPLNLTIQTANCDEVVIRILRKIRHLCLENLDDEINVILTIDLSALIGHIDQIRKLARHEGKNISVIIEQFAALLFASGVIIQTDCPAALRVFDNARFETLLSATTQRKNLTLDYDLQARLEKLLHIENGEIPDYLLENMEEPPIDFADVPPPAPDKPNIPLQEIVLTTVLESLGSLVERFPELAKICRELAALTNAAANSNFPEAETCALSLGEQLGQLTHAVEDTTLELFSMDLQEKTTEKITDREILVPIFDEAAHRALADTFAQQHAILTTALEKLAAAAKPITPTIDFSAELAELEKEKSRLLPAFEAIRQAEESAQEIETDLTEQIEEELKQQLKYGSPREKALAKAMLSEAEKRLTAVQTHLAELQAMRQPIEDALNQINRRANILRACQRKLELPPISIPEIPALTVSAVIPSPENIELLPPELSMKIPKPPPDTSPSFAKEGAVGEVAPTLPTPPTSDFYHLLAITAFFVCGPSKLPPITKAMSSLSILSDAAEQAAFKTACHQSHLIHTVSPDTFQLDEAITYSPWMDEIIPEAKQKELCQLVHLPPPELAPLELLAIATLSTFRQISSRWISHLLTRQELVKGKQIKEIYIICSQLKQAGEYIVQCGAFGGTAVYKIKKDVKIPWKHAVLSPREAQLLQEEYAKVRLEKKRQHGEAP